MHAASPPHADRPPPSAGKLALDRLRGLSPICALGVVLMFGPVLWLALSSFKTPAAPARIPAPLLPHVRRRSRRRRAMPQPLDSPGDDPDDANARELAQVRRIGIQAQMVDPAKPRPASSVPIDNATPLRDVQARDGRTIPSRWSASPSAASSAIRVFVTVVATLITLIDQLDGGLSRCRSTSSGARTQRC